ncbi:MAG: OmpA family protein [Polyangiaceae bacterium]
MIRKILAPMFAVAALGMAFSFNGCSCHAEAGTGAQTPPPPPPVPEPPPVVDAGPPPAPPPPPEPVKPKLVATGKAKIEGTRVKIPGELEFDVDKATLKNTPQTTDILTELQKFLTENKSVTKLRIEGHTDSSGTPVKNVKLSQDRADTVVKYLVGKGIDQSRLVGVGYGMTRPVAPNDTPANKALNRRTEFHVQEIDGKVQGDLPPVPGANGLAPGASAAATPAAAPSASGKH